MPLRLLHWQQQVKPLDRQDRCHLCCRCPCRLLLWCCQHQQHQCCQQLAAGGPRKSGPGRQCCWLSHLLHLCRHHPRLGLVQQSLLRWLQQDCCWLLLVLETLLLDQQQ